MYEENKAGFVLRDILLQIILVVIFVFILLWLFPTKGYVDNKIDNGLNPLYKQLFNEHLESMKGAAQSYYTTSRLPKKVGDKVSITLGEMLDKKLISAFVDSNNKQCNLTGSYVEITKMDSEYMMKVNLNCSDNSDYIIVYMGCYNYCDSALCEKQDTKETNNKEKTKKEEKKEPTPTPVVNKEYKYEYVLNTKGSYSDWSNWSNWSTTNVSSNEYRDVETKKVYEVTSTSKVKVDTIVSYKTPDYITKTVSYSSGISCPSGYRKYDTSLSSNSKLCIADPISTSSTTYTTTDIKPLTKTTYVCSDGSESSTGYCSKQVTETQSDVKNGTPYTAYGTWEYQGRKSYDTIKVSTDTTKYVAISSSDIPSCNASSCTKITRTVYDVYTRPVTNSYGCPAGYTLSGSKCNGTKQVTKTVQVAATKKTITYCENGKTPVNGSCGTVSTPKSTSSIKCPGNGTYDANSGFCYVRGTEYNTCEGTINGSKCTVKVADCSKLNGILTTDNKCKVSTDVYTDKNNYNYVTYYRYRTRSYTAPTTDYKWSNSNNDNSLIKAGYKLTGKKEEIKK